MSDEIPLYCEKYWEDHLRMEARVEASPLSKLECLPEWATGALSLPSAEKRAQELL